ncbi:MAG: hypothetical protein FWE62_06015, partial [Firmicutes bacterium]|nr:hypothetical protein [Bacillota bacterium]
LLRTSASVWANIEGYDGMQSNLTLSGDVEIVDTISGSEGNWSITTKTETITPETGYVLQKQAGRFHALDFISKLVKNPDNYTENSYGSALSHIGAQTTFLRSCRQSKPIAMLAEGSWWNNEARSTFSAMVSEFGPEYSRQNRNFGFLPFPKPDDSYGPGSTLVSLNNPFAFINGNATGGTLEAAKAFYRFAHSDKGLTIFTKTTGMCKGLQYNISGDDFDDMSFYARSVYNAHKTAKIVYPVSKTPKVANNSSYFEFENWSFGTIITAQISTSGSGKGAYNNPFVAFKQSQSGHNISVKEYFDGMYDSVSKSYLLLK